LSCFSQKKYKIVREFLTIFYGVYYMDSFEINMESGG
jgi:hypothetical protein